MENVTYPKKKQITLIILCALAYITAYLGRYSYSSNINLFISEYNITKAEAGLVTSFFFFSYGAGQIINGLLSKYYNKRYIITTALIISSIVNLLVFIGVPFNALKFLWLINGLAQSMLWSSLILLLSENLDKKYLRLSILIMSVTVPIGTFLIYGSSALFVSLNNYKLTFIVSSVIMAIMAIIWVLLYKKNIRSEKLSEITFKEELSATDDNSYKSSKRYIILLFISLSIIAILDNLLKDGIQTWVPTILKESYGINDSISILLTLILPLFSVFGATLAVFLNKRIKDFIYLSVLFFALTSLLIFLVTKTFNLSTYILLLIYFVLIELFLHAVNNIITSMAPLLLRRRINSGFTAGFLNGMCYIGSVISSYGIGALADKMGNWKDVFMILFIISLVSLIVGIVYFIIKRIIINKEKHKKIIKDKF